MDKKIKGYFEELIQSTIEGERSDFIDWSLSERGYTDVDLKEPSHLYEVAKVLESWLENA